MKALNYKTKSARKQDVVRRWYLVDAENEVLGRIASRIAIILQGKNKPEYTPHVDTGDHVIVINAEKVRLTGNKLAQREYRRNTGYPGGLRSETVGQLLQRKPTLVVERSVQGMLPKTKLGNAMAKKLHVYAGAAHNHQAQKPEKVKLNNE